MLDELAVLDAVDGDALHRYLLAGCRHAHELAGVLAAADDSGDDGVTVDVLGGDLMAEVRERIERVVERRASRLMARALLERRRVVVVVSLAEELVENGDVAGVDVGKKLADQRLVFV